MKDANLKSKLPAIRAAINAALVAVAKEQGLSSLVAGKCTYDPSGNFTFKVDGVVAGGLDREGAAYEQMQDLLGLPKLGTTFTHRGEESKIIGLNTTGTKVITEKGGKKFIWPVESIKKIVGLGDKTAPKKDDAPKRALSAQEEAALDKKQANGFTLREMNAAFDRVKDATHWKNRINTVVEVKDETDRRLIEEAVVWFTGSVPTLQEVKKATDGSGKTLYRIKAAGYYATIGA